MKTKKSLGDAKTVLNINAAHHIAFTDGGCHPNNKSKESRAGYASIFVSGSLNDKCIYGNLSIIPVYASNIRAEGMAVIRVLETVNSTDNWDKLTIITDCQHWINMIQHYMPKWDLEKFKEKANSDLTIRMWKAYNEVKKKGVVELKHIKSHNKNGWKEFADGTFEKFCYEQNNYADILCNYARKTLSPNEEITESVCYE